MRVFIGIKASGRLQTLVREWRGNYKNLPVRWIKDRNLHLTLVPPWYEKDVGKAVAKLKTVRYKKRTITFARIGVNFKHKVLWIGKPTQHVTIARFKDPAPLRNIHFKKINWYEKVNNVTLFESRLRAKGADYTPIASMRLI
jgi:2'-5' RNA ligase